MKALFLTILIAATLCGSRPVVGQATPAYHEAEAYAVYSAIIMGEWPVREAKATNLVIQAETEDYPRFGTDRCLVPAKGEEGIFGSAIAAYREANKKSRRLQRKFGLPLPYQLVPKSSLEALYVTDTEGRWKSYYAKYPKSGGSFHMSAVGFNADKTIAIVYMGHWCGGLCGGGTYHFLQKTKGIWAPIDWQGNRCGWSS